VIARALARVVARQARPTPLHLLPAYAAGLRDQRAAHRAAIPVERIAAPLLLISGQDDQVWPAGAMADAIVARRSTIGRAQGDRHVSYADAGHIIRPPIGATTVLWTERLYSGGTPLGQAAAQAGAWQEIVQFLADHLG
jgi:fermentation-respiration switch protein FrsA (DUF1100 family)